jgi:hypothetical protein
MGIMKALKEKKDFNEKSFIQNSGVRLKESQNLQTL